MKVTLIQATQDPVNLIAKIASICYDSQPKNPLGLVKHLYRNGHHSVFEHVHFTFLVEGISRACSHQIVRHRHCSFTQRSQRYCSEDSFGFVVPATADKDVFRNAMREIEKLYEDYQAAGTPNEDARYILPNACETQMYISCNLRELMHMCNERLCMRAQWEIRELVGQMKDLVDPALHFMLVPKCKSGRIICNQPCKEGGGKDSKDT